MIRLTALLLLYLLIAPPGVAGWELLDIFGAGSAAPGSAAPGCTDPTAINFDASASEDDGRCIGSVFNLSGVFYVVSKTGAGAAPMQFQSETSRQTSFVSMVEPGGPADKAGVRKWDEFLALCVGVGKQCRTVSNKGAKPRTTLVSGRGTIALQEAMKVYASVRPGKKLTWVLRKQEHAATQQIQNSFEVDQSEAFPPPGAAEPRSFTPPGLTIAHSLHTRGDLGWCVKNVPGEVVLDGRYVLTALTAELDDRLVTFEAEIVSSSSSAPYIRDLEVATTYDTQAKLHVNRLGQVGRSHANKGIKAGFEVLKIGEVPVGGRGKQAIAYALSQAAAGGAKAGDGSTTVTVQCLRPPRTPSDKQEKQAEAWLTEVQQLLHDNTADFSKPPLTVKQGQQVMGLIKKAARTGALANPLQHTGTFHQLANVIVSTQAVRNVQEKEAQLAGGGWRAEFLEISLPLIAMSLEMTLTLVRGNQFPAELTKALNEHPAVSWP